MRKCSRARISGCLVRGAFTVLAVLVLARLAYSLFDLGFGEPFELWTFVGIEAVAATICFTRAALIRAERLVWLLAGLASALWFAGDLVWGVAFADLRDPPFPSVVDALWLLAYLPMLAAVVSLARARSPVIPRQLLIDGVLAGLAAATVVSAFFFHPALTNTDGSALALATNLAYPLADVLLISVAIAAVAARGWRVDQTWFALIVGFTLWVVADGAYAFLISVGSYGEGTLVDFLYSLGIALVAVAAWRPAGPPLGAPAATPAEMFVPASLALLALSAMILDHFQPLPLISVILATLTLTIAIGRGASTYALTRALGQSRRDALTDPLTGIGNRAFFFSRLEYGLAAARRDGRVLALLFLDVNGLKQINDSHGHRVGDECLRTVARRMRESAREVDTIARIGGDEFAVLLDAVPTSELAIETAERLAAAVNRPLPAGGHEPDVTVAIGLALAPGRQADVERLLRDADEAMYDAKREGVALRVHELGVERPGRERPSAVRIGDDDSPHGRESAPKATEP